MKNMFRAGAVFLGVLVTSAISVSILSADHSEPPTSVDSFYNNRSAAADACSLPRTSVSQDESCSVKGPACCDDERTCCTLTPCPDCWELKCHDEKYYYEDRNYVKVDCPVLKRQCRCVPVTCDQWCIRYVPKTYQKEMCYYEAVPCAAPCARDGAEPRVETFNADGDNCCNPCPAPCPPSYKYVKKTKCVDCIGYFPEYYCVQKCTKRYEYFYIYVNQPYYQWTCEPRAQVITRYHWERVCNNPICCTPCPDQGCDVSSSCGAAPQKGQSR